MAKTLERRTSQAAQTTDQMYSLRCNISTPQRRVRDYEQTLAGMSSERKELRRDLDYTRRAPHDAATSDTDVSKFCNALVIFKPALVEAKRERQTLEFEMKKFCKSERKIQDRLAAHASRTEVQLAQANQEID